MASILPFRGSVSLLIRTSSKPKRALKTFCLGGRILPEAGYLPATIKECRKDERAEELESHRELDRADRRGQGLVGQVR